jgi:hypothetical protein
MVMVMAECSMTQVAVPKLIHAILVLLQCAKLALLNKKPTELNKQCRKQSE